MNRFLSKTTLFISLLFVGASAYAGGGTSITLDTRALALLPGTVVHAEITAEYQLHDTPTLSKANAGKTIDITDDTRRYRIPAQDIALWDFTVPAAGTVPPKKLVLHFKDELPAPPPKLMASVAFPVHLRITRPDGTMREYDYTFAMSILVDTPSIARCFTVYGGGKNGIGAGVLPACDWKPGKNDLVVGNPPTK